MNRLRLNRSKYLFCQLGGSLILISSLSTSAQETASGITTISTQSPMESIFPMLLGLLSILALIFGLAFVLKRFTNFNPGAGNIKVLESQRLGAKERLVIVEVQGQQLLLGVTPQSITQLAELKRPIEARKNFTNFESLMKQVLNPAGFVNAKKSSEKSNKKGHQSSNAPMEQLENSGNHSIRNQNSHENFEDS
ncbi:MAG: flagellar biosynthetic protein FliO [Kangiellaceae bacterium]|nr:flagellar biosynthetic protein FliO [Kangiellaceae bacterium]MCW9016125.1 flagellar biosynthetic protein FliO [Kangiellaceae bacterium]